MIAGSGPGKDWLCTVSREGYEFGCYGWFLEKIEIDRLQMESGFGMPILVVY